MGSTDLLSNAKRNLVIAESVLNETYPVVKETKLLLAVGENIFAAIAEGIDFFLEQKLDSRGHDTFESAFREFEVAARSFGFTDDDFEFVNLVKKLVDMHKDSPVEFSRQDGFVICDKAYNLSKISYESMQKYLFRARLFIEKVSSVPHN